MASTAAVSAKEPRVLGPAGSPAKGFLEERWAELKSQANPVPSKQLVVAVVAERLQWEILAEEMPLAQELNSGSRRHRDRPPPECSLSSAAERVRRVESDPQAEGACLSQNACSPQDVQQIAMGSGCDLGVLADVGQERVEDLLRYADAKRSIMRIGLVARRAIAPSGTKPGARAAQFGMRVVVGPVLWLPLLLAVAAPGATMLAGLLTAMAVAVATGRWVTIPADLVVLTGILITGVIWWALYHPRVESGIGPPDEPASDSRRQWIKPALGLVVALLYLAVVLCSTVWKTPVGLHSEWRASACVAVLVMLATVLPLWRVLVFRGGRAWAAILVSGGTSAILGFVIGHCMSQTEQGASWLALLIIYFPLLVEQEVLNWLFSGATPVVQDSAKP